MGREPEQNAVRSADGTRIGFTTVGSGPVPLVLVHGALSSGAQWMPVARELAEHCTCYVMDRWGRGESGHHADYSLQREAKDIEAVLDVAGPEACLLGHSSGAIYTLEVARRRSPAALILYEPPLHGLRGRFADDIWDRIRRAAEEDRYEDVVSIFLTDEGMLPEEVLSSLQATPLWEHRVALAPQSVREWEELIRAAPAVERYRSLAMPTLLVAGTETQGHPSFATRELQAALPDARTVVLERQGHTANLTAPDRVAREVTAFLRGAAG